MTYAEFKLYMQAGYKNDIPSLREIEVGNYAEGYMCDEDIELIEDTGHDTWQQYAGRYATELEAANAEN